MVIEFHHHAHDGFMCLCVNPGEHLHAACTHDCAGHGHEAPGDDGDCPLHIDEFIAENHGDGPASPDSPAPIYAIVPVDDCQADMAPSKIMRHIPPDSGLPQAPLAAGRGLRAPPIG